MLRSWYRGQGVLVIGSAIALVAAYADTFRWMMKRFLEDNSYYSHGFLIPLVSAYLIWQKREQLASLQVKPALSGLFIAAGALGLHLIGGSIFAIGSFSGLTLIPVLIGLSLFLYGTEITRQILVPILFLFFMVPMPQVLLIAITFKMKMLAASAAVTLVQWMGLNIQGMGSTLLLPTGILTVENECSGISSLISILTLSVLVAYSMQTAWHKRTALVLASIPIALGANIARIVFLILASYIYGIEIASKGILHYGAGIILWGVAIALLVALWKVME